MRWNEKTKGYFFLLLTFSLWGSVYVVSKYVLGKMPPFTISFVRFGSAFLALTFACRKGTKKIEKKDYKYIFLIGFAGYFLAVGAQLLGTKYAGASLASLVNSLNPVAMTLFAAILLHEVMTVRKGLGIFLALAGVYVIVGGGSRSLSVTGVALSVFSVLVWSLVSVLTKKVTQKYDSLKVTRYGAGVAALFYLPVGILEVTGDNTLDIDIFCVVGLLYMGVICTGVAYFLWNKSLSILEAGTCSAFYPIQPLVSTLLGILFLQEKVGLSFLIGALFIVTGVLVSLSTAKNKSAEVSV